LPHGFISLPGDGKIVDMMRIAVIDGQGGGIGSVIVRALREAFGDSVEVLALGTNSAATSAMMKARADKGATGENAIRFNSGRVDLITGPLSVVLPNGMLGEVTPAIAETISTSGVRKFLLPLNQERIEIVGNERDPLPHLVERLLNEIKTMIQEEQHV